MGRAAPFRRCQEPQISDFVDEMPHINADFLHFTMLILLLFFEAMILQYEKTWFLQHQFYLPIILFLTFSLHLGAFGLENLEHHLFFRKRKNYLFLLLCHPKAQIRLMNPLFSNLIYLSVEVKQFDRFSFSNLSTQNLKHGQIKVKLFDLSWAVAFWASCT